MMTGPSEPWGDRGQGENCPPPSPASQILCRSKNLLIQKALRDYIWWKQQVGNTDFLTWLFYPPYGLVPMSTWKIPYRTFFFRFETGLPEWIFQIWSKVVKSDRVFVYMKKSLFWAFWGPTKVSRPLVVIKLGAGSEKNPKNGIGRSGRPKLRRYKAIWGIK